MPVIAGVDSSTQSTKVVLLDADTGELVGSGSAPHPAVTPPRSEQWPADWWRAMRTAWGAAIADGNIAPTEVRAISIAAQCHGLVALDAKGEVIRPVKLWNDTTSAPEMAELREALPAEEWARRTGSVPTAAFTVSKLLWLKRHEPDNFASIAHILLPHDWLTWNLTGRFTTDRSEASGTGYYDAEHGSYDREILDLIEPDAPWEDWVPQVLAPIEPAGVVTGAAAEVLGVSPGTIVAAGAGDQHASALALGVTEGDRVISYGTSGVVFSVSSEAVHDAEGIVDGVADAAGGYLPLVSTLNAARVTDTFARILGVGHAELSEMALRASSSDLPVLAAFFDGERKPNLPDATGILSGIRTDLSREQFARAAFDGVVFGLKRGSDQLDRVGVPFTGKLVLTGGGARSAAYQQLTADAFARPVYTSPSHESVAVGAAIQAAAAAEDAPIAEVRSAWSPDPVHAADPADTAASSNAYERYLVAADWRGADERR